MSGFHLVERAIMRADDPSNNGNGYTLRVWMRSGAVFHGGVIQFSNLGLVLDLWESTIDSEHAPAQSGRSTTDREIMIDPVCVEAIEVVW